MFKKDSICPECGSELISIGEPEYGLCDDCIEHWREQRDEIDPNHRVHGAGKERIT